jgi:hypothetical protein
MIIYGTRATHLITKPIFSKCPSCGTQNDTVVSIYGKYAHIFWIPLFPFGKEAISQCQHCRNALRENEMTPEIQQEVSAIKSSSKTPIWTFVGLAFLGITFSSIAVSNAKHAGEKDGFYKSPIIGDKYTIKDEGGQYGLMKINRVTKDSLFFFLNNYTISQSPNIDKIDKEENYDKIETGFSKSEISELILKGTITDVRR